MRVVTGALVAVAMRRPHALDLHVAAPVGGGRHRAGVRAKTDQCRLIAKPLSAELADVQLFADDAHFGVTGVAYMGIMRPDNCLGLRSTRLEEMFERLEHVRVAQVPGFRAAIVHDPIVALGGSDQACVLRRVQKTFAILSSVFKPTLKEFPTLIDHRLFAFAVAFCKHRPSVG